MLLLLCRSHFLEVSRNASAELKVLGHDGLTFGVNASEVRDRSQADEVVLGGGLDESERTFLESTIVAKVLIDLVHQPHEVELGEDQAVAVLLELSNLSQGHGSGEKSATFLRGSLITFGFPTALRVDPAGRQVLRDLGVGIDAAEYRVTEVSRSRVHVLLENGLPAILLDEHSDGSDEVLEVHFGDAPQLFVHEERDSLHSGSVQNSRERVLRQSLNVVTEHFSMFRCNLRNQFRTLGRFARFLGDFGHRDTRG